VTQVELDVNGEPLGIDTIAPWAFAWNTENREEGDYKLTAKAFDAAGNEMTATITVKLIDPPPTVTITEPQENSIRRKGAEIPIIASPKDNLGVVRVEYYVDGQLRETDTDAPWQYIWKTQTDKEGQHVVTAKAYDTAGQAKSARVTVELDGTPPQVSMKILTEKKITCRGEDVTIEVDARDDRGSVTRVELLVNGQVHDTDTNPPWQVLWKGIEAPSSKGHDRTLLLNGGIQKCV
jgi:hypothetical protein